MNKFHENGHRWVALNDPHPFLTGWKCVNCGMGTVESDGVMPSSNEKCSASPENSTMQRPLLPKPGLFVVACRGDTDIHGEKGRYDMSLAMMMLANISRQQDGRKTNYFVTGVQNTPSQNRWQPLAIFCVLN